MQINVTAKSPDGSVSFEGSLNKAEVNTLLQYAINNLIAMGFIFGQDEIAEGDDETVRIKKPTLRSVN